jgi:Alcohol dehydrogenase GroES-like domain
MHNGPINPWSESNNPSLRESQGDSRVLNGDLPGQYEEELFNALQTLTTVLDAAGRPVDALESAREAARLYASRSDVRPDDVSTLLTQYCERTGICASDLKYLQFGRTQIAGHEFAGVLEDGTAVAVEGFFGCGKCEQCEQGAYNMCVRGPTAPGMLSPGG